MRGLSCFCVILVLIVMSCGNAISGEGAAKVLFDQGHNQRFVIEEKGELHLSKFAEIFRSQGLQVVSTKKPLDDETLNEISALVISGPFEALRGEEVDAIIRFVEKGGRLVAMLHIGSPFTRLLARLDLDHSNAVIHERRNITDQDINFKVRDLSASPLFAGIEQFSLYGGWALDPGKSAASIARTSAEAWADLDGNKALSKGDAVGAFNMIVSGTLGTGSFVVFGDDAIFQNRYLDEANSRLAANLAGWLVVR